MNTRTAKIVGNSSFVSVCKYGDDVFKSNTYRWGNNMLLIIQ